MDTIKRKPRAVETAEERDERQEQTALLKLDDATAADDAIDAMIRRNIEVNGP